MGLTKSLDNKKYEKIKLKHKKSTKFYETSWSGTKNHEIYSETIIYVRWNSFL